MSEQIYTVRALKKEYGSNFMYLCTYGIVSQLPKKTRREHRKFTLNVEKMPTKQEFRSLLKEKNTVSLESTLADAFSDIELLAEEIQEWYDNLGDNLQMSEKGNMLEECTSALEYLEEIDLDCDGLPKDFKDIQITFIPTHYSEVNSRRERLDEAILRFEAVVSHLTEMIEDEKFTDEESENVLSFVVDELENLIDEAQSVEFPSMY